MTADYLAHVDFTDRHNDPVYQDAIRKMSKRESCVVALEEYLTGLLPEPLD